jgi:hypothetical protein
MKEASGEIRKSARAAYIIGPPDTAHRVLCMVLGAVLNFPSEGVFLPPTDVDPARTDAIDPHIGAEAYSQGVTEGDYPAFGCDVCLGIAL